LKKEPDDEMIRRAYPGWHYVEYGSNEISAMKR
jgi:hypothetical protein